MVSDRDPTTEKTGKGNDIEYSAGMGYSLEEG